MRLWIERRGSPASPPFILVHGFSRAGCDFAPILPWLESSYRILLPDHRGHGRSPRADSYRVVDYAADLVELLREEIDEPAMVYGHSLGAMCALQAASALPERVRALILSDPPFHTMGTRLPGTALHQYFIQYAQAAGRCVTAADLRALLGDIRDAATFRLMARLIAQVDPRVFEPVIAGEWLAGYAPAPVSCPALLLEADLETGGMLTASDAAMVERLASDCTRVRLPGSPHNLHWSHTEAVVRLLLNFLLSLDPIRR